MPSSKLSLRSLLRVSTHLKTKTWAKATEIKYDI